MSQEKSQKSVPWAWIIAGILAAVVAGGFMIKAFEGVVSYYMTADEYVSARPNLEGKYLKIAGNVQAGSLTQTDDLYEFTVEYKDASFPVRYRGFAPDTFKEGVEVVVEGKEKGEEVFVAKNMMAKCASKYEVGGLPPLEESQ